MLFNLRRLNPYFWGGADFSRNALASQVIRAIQQHREREIAASVVAKMLDHGIDPQQIIGV